jgi:hypothetical protein
VAIGLLENPKHRFLVGAHSFIPRAAYIGLIKRRRRITKAFVPNGVYKIVRDAKAIKRFEILPILPSYSLKIRTAADQVICIKSLNTSKIMSKT